MVEGGEEAAASDGGRNKPYTQLNTKHDLGRVQREMVYDGRQPIKMDKSLTPDLASRSLRARLLKQLPSVVAGTCAAVSPRR